MGQWAYTSSTDKLVLDDIAEGLRTPEWSVSFLEDIADHVRTVRDLDRLNDESKGEEDWSPH